MRLLRLLIPSIILLFATATPASAQTAIRVYYVGPGGAVLAALKLAHDTEIVNDPTQADAIVVNGAVPDSAAPIIRNRVSEGAGLVLLLGPQTEAAALAPFFGDLVTLEARADALSLAPAEGIVDPVLSEIVWTSAPQVRERVEVGGAQLDPLIVGFEHSETILGTARIGEGRVYVFTAFLDDANPQFQSWTYFNYFIYHLALRAAGQTPLSFADYPASPVPHARDRAVLFIGLGLMVGVSFSAFWAVRRYSLAHPELLDVMVADRAGFVAREASTDWETVGFHRPLGGFLFALMLGLILFIPLIIYQNLILPVYILPSAQALGIWGRVVQFFGLVWQLFDMGTSVAFIKFMSEYRVHDPRRGIQYGQVFVWWQALSGAVQVAIVTVIAGALLPHTVYALYAWSIIIHTLIQLPGFYQVMRHALMGLQRFDYAQTLELALALIFPILAQPIIVSLMVAWGRANPIFGVPTGGLLGLGFAAYAAEALTFLLGLWLYRRLGYNARLLFLAHFNWDTVKQSFRFGVFEMLGSIAWAGGQAMEIVITQTRLVNYAEVWGNWGVAQNFVFAFNAVQILHNGLMPAISESISHARQALSQYYSVMAYKWGGLISAFIGAVLLAVADRFIIGASGPEFARAAVYAIPLIIWGALQYPSWVTDAVELAANRPYLKSAMVFGEQVVRITLAYLLVGSMQINGLIVAYFVGLLGKGVVGYFVNHRLCFPQRFYWWQSLIAPLLAGAAHYAVLRWLTGLIWRGDQITSVIIFFIGILPSYPLFTFFFGLFGGWEAEQLQELRRAVELSSFMKPFAWAFWASTALGARLSPLHGRFPISIRAMAAEEAVSLTEEKVGL